MITVETDTFRSIILGSSKGEIRVDEGDKIKFVTENGEEKIGVVMKISGKGEKAKLQIMPQNSECEEVWSVLVMKEDTLEIIQ
jgi:hypothetical protein